MTRSAIRNLNGNFISSKNRKDAQRTALPEELIEPNHYIQNGECRAGKVIVVQRASKSGQNFAGQE
jgi:hypothetical protein